MQVPLHVVHLIKVVLVAGAERHLLTLIPALRTYDIESTILLLVEPEKPMDDYLQLAAEHDIVVHREVINHHLDLPLFVRLRRRLQTLSPDILHTHLLHADFYGAPTANALGIPVITSRHNDNAFRHRIPMRVLHAGLWRMAAHGIAISEAIRQFAINIEYAPASRISTIHYGIDPAAMQRDTVEARSKLRKELGLPLHTQIVGVMCRLIEQKGLSYGLQAFQQLTDKHPNTHLVIAGDGVLRESLEAEAQQLGLDGLVHFLGWRSDPLQTLAGYDLLLMPSLWEGFGLVMLEAMAQGLPIIGSHVSAIPEVIENGETGLLVPPRDVPALTDALDRLLVDATLREQLGTNAGIRLRSQFSPDHMAARTADLYKRVTKA